MDIPVYDYGFRTPVYVYGWMYGPNLRLWVNLKNTLKAVTVTGTWESAVNFHQRAVNFHRNLMDEIGYFPGFCMAMKNSDLGDNSWICLRLFNCCMHGMLFGGQLQLQWGKLLRHDWFEITHAEHSKISNAYFMCIFANDFYIKRIRYLLAGSAMSCSKPEQVHKFASRQWSSGSLMRGLSFLNDQSKKEQVEYGDILSVPWLLLFAYTYRYI